MIDPSTLNYCPCGAAIQQGKAYFVCRACWITAPDYFRVKFSQSDSDFKREQARNQIMNHARRRGEQRATRIGNRNEKASY